MSKNSLLHAVLGTLEDGIVLLDRAGQVLDVNAAALRLLGYPEEDLLGKAVFATFAPVRQSPSLEIALASRKPCRNVSGLFERRDQAVVAVSCDLDPLVVEQERDYTLLRFREISPVAACDENLRDSESKFSAILDTIVDGVIAADEQGHIQLLNPAAEHLFGYRSEDVLGQNVKMLMPSPYQESHDRYISNYLQTGVKKIIGIGREVTGMRKDGTQFPLYLSIGEAWQGERRLFVAVLHDLTASKQAEEKLLILSSAVEQSPNAIMIADPDGMIEYVNPSFTDLTGYSFDEVVGKNTTLLRTHNTEQEQYRSILETLRQGRQWREEIQGRKKCGELYWAQETITPIRNGEGTIVHFLSIQQDITEQKRDKESLLESEERFRQVAEMTGEWLWEQDPEGRYSYSSSAVNQVIGYLPEEILGKRYLDLMTEEDKNRWSAEMPPTPEVKQPFHRLVNRYRHRNGLEVFTESSGEPIFDADGRLVKWRGVDHDITARKHYEDALHLRDRAIEAASVGINITGAAEKQYANIYVNSALSQMTGYSREELVGCNMRILQGPDTDKAAVEEINHALAKGVACEVILKNYRKDGSWFWNDLFISPVRNEAGKLTHFIGIQNDVTERLLAEEARHELEIARQIQLSLLPKTPLHLEGVQVAGVCLTANHVGGDYYDFFRFEDCLDIVIADVSGHSVGAALIMVEVRSALKAEQSRTANAQSEHVTAEILHALNDLLYDDLNGADVFISMFYLRYNLDSRLLSYANAGQNCPLVLSEGELSCQQLDAEGMIFGVKKQVEFEEKRLQLKPGDKVLLYTDGVVEAQNRAGEFFGVSRLCELFSAYGQESPETVIEKLVLALSEFCGGHSFYDDVSMVVLKVQ